MRISDWSSDVCSSDLAIPDSDLLIVLASAMMHDRPDGFAPDWHPYQVILRDLAWAMCSSSTGLNNTLLAPLGRNVTLEDHVIVAQKFIDEEIEKRSMTTAERSEEHTSELQSLMRISYAVFF